MHSDNHSSSIVTRWRGLLGAALIAVSIQSADAAVDTVRLVLPAQEDEVLENLGKVFERQIGDRSGARVILDGDAPLTVELAVAPGIGAEGYRIEDRQDGGVRIVGNDPRGVVAGTGKFLRSSRYDQGGFTTGNWRGASVPQKPRRGIYFATHFHNYYHEAPVGEITCYVEDLALWGLNELVVWYDAHHFAGFDDPGAVAFRERLRSILLAAKRIGMDVSLVVIGNEAYGNSPAELRAAPGGGRGGYYPCAVCPSKPDGMKYILRILGEQFDWAADLKPRSVWIWPYDQGGCGCADCQPWGSKGFMKCFEEVGKMAREKMPGTKILLSTWFMDSKELAAVMKILGERKDLADGLINEGSVLPAPAGLAAVDRQPGADPPVLRHELPVVGFPEISMHETFPWGGFGATPLTARAQVQWNARKDGLAGGFPYSEGIYEDITKVVYSQFYWNDQTAAETVREYIAFEFSPDVVEDVEGVIRTLEQNHRMRWWPGKLEGVPLEMNWFPSRGAKPRDDPGAEEAYATMRKVDAALTPQARKSWRWRQLYLRALLDSELKTNGGSPNDRCNEAFAELIEIYHAENAIGGVRPPLPKGWKPSSDSPSESVGGEDDVGDPSEPWAYLDNGTIRIGVDKSRGAAIGYLALSSTKRNLLNHHDEGRFIQQSYYGDSDGSLWAKEPWVYNPVQGGSYKGEDARTLEFRKSRDELHAKVEPLHWASAKPCPEAIMQEWITLDGPLARIRMRMDYSGPTQQRNAHQELPAMFVDFALPHLMFELDGKLVKHAPAMLGANLKPENIRYDTEWLAFVDDDGFGIGIHTPGTGQAVTYRHRGNGTTGPDGSACSYVAPVRTMQLKKGTVVDYHFHLTIGTLDEIRRRFGTLAATKPGIR